MLEPIPIKTDPDSVTDNTELQTQESLSVKGEQTQQSPKGLESTEGVNAFEPEALEPDSFLNALIENNQNKAPEQDTNQAEVDVEALQQLIAEGADPTRLLEETAAGEGEPTDGGGIYIPTIERTAAEVLADAGFDTAATESQELVEEEVLITEPVVIEPPINEQDPIAGAPITLRVDDQNLANGSTPVGGDVFHSNSIVFTEGSDAIASIVFGTNLSSLVGLTWTRISENEIVGKDGADTIVRLDLSVTGTTAKVTATLNDNYDSHPDITTDDLQSLGSVGVIATDTDGDAATGIVNVEVSDDGPTITTGSVVAADTLTVDETTLSTDATANFANNFTPAINYGADGAGSTAYSLSLSSTSVGSGLYALGTGAGVPGTEITMTQTGNTITGSVGTDNYFTIAIDTSTGVVTFDQLAAIYHANENNPDDSSTLATTTASDLKLTATVTDADGDSVTHDLNLGASIFSIKDDGPSAFTPESASIVNLAGNAFEFNIDFEAAAGADGVGNVVFTTVDSTPLLDTNGKVITFDGQTVYLYNKSAGNVIEGRTSDAGENSGDLAFTATLIPGTDTYSIDLEGVLRNNPSFSFDTANGIGGGNTTFFAMGIGSGNENDVLVSGSDTVNTSTGNIGIGTGQSIGSGDTARFDMVKNIVSTNGSTASHSGHYEISTYIQEISSVQGNSNEKTKFIVTIRTGDNDNDYFGDASDETHNGNITVKVYDGDPDAGGTLKNTYSDTDNDVEVKDVKQGYFVEITSTDAFSIVEYAYEGDKPFSLGDIRVATGNPLDDFAFELLVQGIDGDGDTVTSSLTINLEAELGLAGGHIDVDTYNDTGSTGVNNSDAHKHQFDDTYGRHIDAFDNFGSNLHQIDQDILSTNDEVFRLFVINAHRNPGGEIKINGTRYDVINYGEGFQGQGTDSQLYTLNSTLATTYDNVELLTSLVTSFDTGSILDGGVRGSVTGDVKSNQLSGVGEWRTGAFSVMAVDVTHSNTAQAGDLSTTDGYSVTSSAISVYGQSLDVITAINTSGSGDGILWETSVFSHWGGPSGKDYGDLTESQWDDATGKNDLPANAPYPGPGDGTTAPTLAEIHDFYTQFVDGVVVSNGSDGSDILVGGESIDTLDGGDGGDLLLGGNSGDSLTGGKGNDTMVGGLGNDTFKWQAGETGTDTITDWGTGTDILDLSDLLQNETTATLDDFLNFSYATNNTTLTIDVDGSGNDSDQVIVFESVDLITSSNLTDLTIITNLLNSSQLITDN